jgi:hypothetical protein
MRVTGKILVDVLVVAAGQLLIPFDGLIVFHAGIIFSFEPVKDLMIRKLKSGQYRIYSRKKDAKTNKRRNLGTFDSIEAAKKHEKAIQYFKHG